ncbi:MAG: TCP-1/cpn60 chaperonin family protein, partial [Halobacteriota archaeon]
KILLNVAEEQLEECGDGTTTATMFAGDLITGALDLLDDGIHPTTIAEGYALANQLVKEEIVEMATPFDFDDDEAVRRVARSTIHGKGGGALSQDRLADVALEVIRGVTVDGTIELDTIKIDKTAGGTASAIRVYKGALIEKDVVRPEMARSIPDARILTLNQALEPSWLSDEDARARVDDPDTLTGLRDVEQDRIVDLADHFEALGVDAIFFTDSSNDDLDSHLENRGILAQRVAAPKLRFLQTVLDTRMPKGIAHVTENDLSVGHIRYDASRERFHVEGDRTPGVTVSIRGAVKQLVEEIHRTLTDAFDSIAAAATDAFVVSGGGATEVELARRLRIHAREVSDRRQLVVNRFADTLERIPQTLARNSGMDGVDTLIALRNAHATDEVHAGIDPFARTVTDMQTQGVVEPVTTKVTAFDLATEAATIVARIDGRIPTAKNLYRDQEDGQ